jgi:hypothetical protein
MVLPSVVAYRSSVHALTSSLDIYCYYILRCYNGWLHSQSPYCVLIYYLLGIVDEAMSMEPPIVDSI